jgi:hypothetical protein
MWWAKKYAIAMRLALTVEKKGTINKISDVTPTTGYGYL